MVSKKRLTDSRTLILILLLLFVAGTIFSSYIIYRSFNLAKEEANNVGRIRFNILPKPEEAPEATGKITFKILERPEE